MANPKRIPHKFKPWIEARRRHGLSHAQVQMARELNLDPKRLHTGAKKGDPAAKLPYPDLIERLYRERFNRATPLRIQTIEEMAAEHLRRRRQCLADRSSNEAEPDIESGDGPRKSDGNRGPSVHSP